MFVQVERRLFTVSDYHQMAQTGVLTADDRVELIRGEIIAISPIGVRHAACVARLTDLFTFHFRGQAIVSVQNPVRLNEMSEPEPDVMPLRMRSQIKFDKETHPQRLDRYPKSKVKSGQALKYRDDYYAKEAPTGKDVLLAVEVLDSTFAYDKSVKQPLYAQANIPEVWIINLVDNGIEIHHVPKGDQYAKSRKAYWEDAVTAVSFPDIQFITKELIGS
ncbi:MAG: Uma2 family endonuclease [Chloroflexi bacterium]|nr:Uma2 family endonuclease [Chloroflexota bacterium]